MGRDAYDRAMETRREMLENACNEREKAAK